MELGRGNKRNLWTVAVMAITLLLALNALVFLILCFVGIGLALEPAAGMVSAVFALLGLIAVPVSGRMKVPKGWCRGLLAAVACNCLIVVFFCVAAAALLFYIQ